MCFCLVRSWARSTRGAAGTEVTTRRQNGRCPAASAAVPARLVAGQLPSDYSWSRTRAVLDWIEQELRPAIAGCGETEIAGLLAGLAGRFVWPGPSGAPSRGRPE